MKAGPLHHARHSSNLNSFFFLPSSRSQRNRRQISITAAVYDSIEIQRTPPRLKRNLRR